MFELNDQELTLVAGGLVIKATSAASGGATTASGLVSSYSYSNSQVGPKVVNASAGNTSHATGTNTTATSSSLASITLLQ